MSRERLQFQALIRMAGAGQLRPIVTKLRERLWSDATFYCLRRDLDLPFEPPAPKIPVTVRKATQEDARSLFALNLPGISPDEVLERVSRMSLFQSGIPTFYVGVTADNKPCYVQWLMAASENARLQEHFHGLFPLLAPDEALLEGAFTPESYRGLGIMGYATARIAEKARELGARYVLTFADANNIPSLKGGQRAGFVPYSIRRSAWRGFRLHVVFTPLPAGSRYPFEIEPASRPA